MWRFFLASPLWKKCKCSAGAITKKLRCMRRCVQNNFWAICTAIDSFKDWIQELLNWNRFSHWNASCSTWHFLSALIRSHRGLIQICLMIVFVSHIWSDYLEIKTTKTKTQIPNGACHDITELCFPTRSIPSYSLSYYVLKKSKTNAIPTYTFMENKENCV